MPPSPSPVPQQPQYHTGAHAKGLDFQSGTRVENDRMTEEALDERRRALAAQIAEIAGASALLPGTLLARMMRCGKPSCGCKADPPRLHRPYIPWTPKTRRRTRTRRLSH